MFVGFDELWCFDQAPRQPKPDDLSIVPPLQPLQPDPTLLRSWFEASRCLLGLVVGAGLNYVTGDPSLPEVLAHMAGNIQRGP